jgi:hypothetical protein
MIVLACVVASAARLRFVLTPTGLDPRVLDRLVSRDRGGGTTDEARLEGLAASVPEAEWERGLFRTLRSPPSARTALVNEQLTELDHRVKRWARVPRVCASICTSSGFLLAAMVLRSTVADEASDSMTEGRAIVDTAVFRAIDVVAVGLAGAAFCVAIQMRARSAAAATMLAYDRLVQRLERAAPRTSPRTSGDAESSDVRTA